MEELNNIYKSLYNNMDIIIDTIVSYYGEEYRKKIESNLKRTYFLFESLPEDNYKYVNNHTNCYVDKKKRNEIINEYNDYVNKEKSINKYVKKEKEKFIIEYFKLNNNKIVKKNIEKFTHLIDKYLSLPNNLKNYLHYKKIFKMYHFDINLIDEEFYNSYNIEMHLLDDHKALYLVEKTKYWDRLRNEIKDKDIKYLTFLTYKKEGHVHIYFDEEENCYYKYIKIPIINYIVTNCENIIDMAIIHEIIHTVESDEKGYGTGILNVSSFLDNVYVDSNYTVNELKTQIFTYDIVKKLHDKGVFLYKNDNIKNGKGKCDYDKMFIFCNIFYEYMNIFKYCAMNNDSNYLNKLFGDAWDDFSKKMDEIYEIVKYKEMNEYLQKQVNKVNKLYNNMVKYYEKHGKYETMNNSCKNLVKKRKIR